VTVLAAAAAACWSAQPGAGVKRRSCRSRRLRKSGKPERQAPALIEPLTMICSLIWSTIAIVVLLWRLIVRMPEHALMTDGDNGILATIPGNFIAAAVLQCPAPRTAQAEVHQVTINAGWAGRVLITCRLAKSRKFWTAVRADRIES
jgi:hypothetical protein